MKNLFSLLFLLSIPIFLSCGEDKVTNNDDKNSISETEYFHVRGNIVDRSGNYITPNYQDEAPIVELYKTSDTNFGQDTLLRQTEAKYQGLFVFDSVKNDKNEDFFIIVKYEDVGEKYQIAKKDSIYELEFDQYMDVEECGNLRVILLDNDHTPVKNTIIQIKESYDIFEEITNDQGIAVFNDLPLNTKLKVTQYNENNDFESKYINTYVFDCNDMKTEAIILNRYGTCCDSKLNISLSSHEYIHDITKAEVEISGSDSRIKSPDQNGNLTFSKLCNTEGGYIIRAKLDSFQTIVYNRLRVNCGENYELDLKFKKCNKGQIIINTSRFFSGAVYKEEKLNWIKLYKDGKLIEEKSYNPPLESSTDIVFKNLLSKDIYYQLVINYDYINYDEDRWQNIDAEPSVHLRKCNEVVEYDF